MHLLLLKVIKVDDQPRSFFFIFPLHHLFIIKDLRMRCKGEKSIPPEWK